MNTIFQPTEPSYAFMRHPQSTTLAQARDWVDAEVAAMHERFNTTARAAASLALDQINQTVV